MTGPKVRVETAEREAAAWHNRLGEPSVSTQTIHDFYAWRQTPENADAYRRVEAVWAEAGRMRADADLQRATQAALTRRTSASWRWWGMGAVAVITAVLVAGVGLRLQAGTLYQTAVGEEEVVQLADGSVVRLDTNTRVRVRYASDLRLLELESGQALFTVAKDGQRPFVVRAGGASVTARGTIFGVRLGADDVRVTLVEGAVDVQDRRHEPKRLAAGQRAAVKVTGVTTAAADLAVETSWSEGRIVLRDVTLQQGVDEVNRYLTRKIVLEPGVGDGDTVNGVFRTGDREAFVATAVGVFGLKATAQSDGSVTLARGTE